MSQVALGMRIWSLVAYQSSHKEAWRRAEPGGKSTGKPIPLLRGCKVVSLIFAGADEFDK